MKTYTVHRKTQQTGNNLIKQWYSDSSGHNHVVGVNNQPDYGRVSEGHPRQLVIWVF